MARFTCAHIKKDNTICGNKCCDPTGCYRHWKLYEKNQKKKPCLFSGCGYHTDNDSGYCSSHSAKIYSHNYRMRQKRKSEGLQPEIPEAPISESYDRSALIHEYLFPVSSQLFADSIRVEVLGDRVVIRGSAPEPPRIYEALVSKSDDEDDEDMGLDLFGD
ncbi:hypothetical protein RhiirA1_404347 [Rhizophagus irregularis]|uniref:Uncharacterized protein n=1 Tax=Rhizophagus irregularis TaxID=588596 RepID=A0A2N0QQQ7_9GLOM|nr:hypothetical protein RhiirA1_404347 [Rhizophagus irregularis]